MAYRAERVRCSCAQSLFAKIFVRIRLNKDCIELNKKERGYDVHNLYMQNLGFLLCRKIKIVIYMYI